MKRSLHLRLKPVLILTWSASLAICSLAACGNVCIATELNRLKGDHFFRVVLNRWQDSPYRGNDKYEITSLYSYPGENIGYHQLGTADRKNPAWLLKNETSGPNATQVHAAGKHYVLRRTIAVKQI